MIGIAVQQIEADHIAAQQSAKCAKLAYKRFIAHAR